MAGLQPNFAKCNCKIIGLSVDPVSKAWANRVARWRLVAEQSRPKRDTYVPNGPTRPVRSKVTPVLSGGLSTAFRKYTVTPLAESSRGAPRHPLPRGPRGEGGSS
jgi:hypothetical protein